MKQVRDLTGQTFNRLTVLELDHKEKYKNGSIIYWKCQCICGKFTVVATGKITNNKTKSCGCLNVESRNKNIEKAFGHNKLPTGNAGRNQIYSAYRVKARRRNLDFSISLDVFEMLTQQNCYYCGQNPSNINKSNKLNGEYIYNGIDRLDNSKGYTSDNVVPCCKVCNYAKNTMTLKEFDEWIEKVYNHRKVVT